jgi:ribosome-binding factor A
MKGVRHDRVEEQIHRLAAEFARDEATSASLLTITRVVLNPSGKDAKIYFTTIPSEEQETALKFLERKSPEFKMFVRDHTRIGMLPHMTFHIDYGERNRQRLDEITPLIQ